MKSNNNNINRGESSDSLPLIERIVGWLSILKIISVCLWIWAAAGNMS